MPPAPGRGPDPRPPDRRPTVGIRREEKNRWETRAPLVPADVARLVRDHGIVVVVQPSAIRAFREEEYEKAGARLAEDLSACDAVFAVKEIPADAFRAGGTYVFFSHTIKGQPHNMPLLRRLMERGASLLDYEKITDTAGRRLVFFGTFAGEAGMVDTLWTLGRRLEAEGIENPFSAIRQTLDYGGLDDALAAVKALGERISQGGLPPGLSPLVVGFLGYGNVSRGAQRVLDLLPVEEIPPSRLAALDQGPGASNRRVYKAVFKEEDLVAPAAPGAAFDLQEYYRHPERYRSAFEPHLKRLTAIVNCVYWTADYPRFVTREALARLFAGPGRPRLRVIGDISCDLDGAVEVTVKATDPGNPVFVHDVGSGEAVDGVRGNGPVVLAVDNLPCELPVDSSTFFSNSLLPFVPAIAREDFGAPYGGLRLPPELKGALILHRGALTPPFRHLEKPLAAP